MAAADHEGVWAPEVRAAFKDWVEASIGFSPDTAAAVVEELEAVLQVSWSVSVYTLGGTYVYVYSVCVCVFKPAYTPTLTAASER